MDRPPRHICTAMRPATIQRARSWIATAFSVVFYVGSIWLTVHLAREYVEQWVAPDGSPWKPRHIAYGLCALIIPWSIWPRKEQFEAPGPRLHPEEYPELFAMIDGVAKATGQSMPAAVFLMAECNAWVQEARLPDGPRPERVMAIGLPLFMMLPAPSLRAIIAHEFGHYHGGDTRDAIRFYRVEQALVDVVNHTRILGVVSGAFLLYLKLFRAVTGRLSRLQEFAADRLAASVESSEAIARGLVELAARGPGFGRTWHSDVASVLDAGYRPPIMDGFRQVLTSGGAQREATTAVIEELRTRRPAEGDSHPPLRQRLAALGVEPTAVPPWSGDSCLELIGSLERVEDALAAHLAPKATKTIAWEDVGSVVELSAATRHIANRGKRLRVLRPRDFRTPRRFAKRMMRHWVAYDRDEMNAEAGNMLGCAITVLLHDRGWRVDSLPDEPTTLTFDGKTVTPFHTANACMRGTAGADAWAQLLKDTDIVNADFRVLYETARMKAK
jgi:heat shock protein HtpX